MLAPLGRGCPDPCKRWLGASRPRRWQGAGPAPLGQAEASQHSDILYSKERCLRRLTHRRQESPLLWTATAGRCRSPDVNPRLLFQARQEPWVGSCGGARDRSLGQAGWGGKQTQKLGFSLKNSALYYKLWKGFLPEYKYKYVQSSRLSLVWVEFSSMVCSALEAGGEGGIFIKDSDSGRSVNIAFLENQKHPAALPGQGGGRRRRSGLRGLLWLLHSGSDQCHHRAVQPGPRQPPGQVGVGGKPLLWRGPGVQGLPGEHLGTMVRLRRVSPVLPPGTQPHGALWCPRVGRDGLARTVPRLCCHALCGRPVLGTGMKFKA